MSLKDKINQMKMYKDWEYDEKQVVLNHIDEAIALYLDARDNPGKHPDIVKEFEKSQGIQYSLLADVKDEGNQSWLSSIEYRDFLFKRLFQ